jgi:hypothetical protein
MKKQKFVDHLKPLSNIVYSGQIKKTDTLAGRLAGGKQGIYSTHLSPWVNNKLSLAEADLRPLVVFPDQAAPYDVVFADTVVISVPTAYSSYEIDGKITRMPADAVKLSNFVKDLFGVVGQYVSIKEIDSNAEVAEQAFYLPTCNIPLPKVWEVCKKIKEGNYKFEGRPIKLVRIDLTTNVPCAVRPYNGDEGNNTIGERFANNKYVGDCCHTYEVRENLTVKFYDKFRYMLEVGSVSEVVGDNLENILVSNQQNIKFAFRHPLFQKQGFGRVESRFLALPNTLEEMVDEHLKYVGQLVTTHGQPTSLQDSWDCFLQSLHTQTLVINDNKDTNEFVWTFARWGNYLTGKANGFSGVGEEECWHAIKHCSMGQYDINVYYFRTHRGKTHLTHTGVILPDPLHKAMLHLIAGRYESKAAVCNSGCSWEDVGLSLPFSLANKNGKGRNIKFRGEAEADAIVPNTLESVESIVRKEKRKEYMREKRVKEEYEKLLQKMVSDQYLQIPEWYRIKHISKLSEVEKAFCTRYEYVEDARKPGWIVRVGRNWYKANKTLNKLLEQKPELPFLIRVWDGGRGYKCYKVWEVEICPGAQIFENFVKKSA